DVDFSRRSITVRDSKGNKDRITVLADRTIPALQVQVDRALTVAADDAARRRGGVVLPHALARKYPNARFEPGWQWVFPARRISADPRTGQVGRYHLFNRGVQRAGEQAASRAGVAQPVTRPAFRHRSATPL